MSTQSSSIFIKHVTVFYKSPTSEWRLRVENQSINVFPLPLVFFYLYHLFFKILNSRILFSLSSSLLHMRVGIWTRISNLIFKKVLIFLTFLPYLDPDSSTRIWIMIRIKKDHWTGIQKKTDADPQPGSAFFFSLSIAFFLGWGS